MDRRRFLAASAAFATAPAWAAAGGPDYLAAARDAAGAYWLCGLRREGGMAFRLALPGRGHAAAGHPSRSEAVAFARRPGSFALVMDCAAGEEVARLEAPAGRHFYGHGAFDPAGRHLYTTENAFESGEGRIGIWDAQAGYRRIGEFASGGIGPHDVLWSATGELVVANGGIRTHPDYARQKLNLDTMRPGLVRLDPETGMLRHRAEAPAALRRNSLRHLAERADGLVAAAFQWEGSPIETTPLVALARPGGELRFLVAPDTPRMKNYAGSIAFSEDGARVAITSPRGGLVQVFDAEDGTWLESRALRDVCGIAPAPSGFALTSGEGRFGAFAEAGDALARFDLAFDNHLIALRKRVPPAS